MKTIVTRVYRAEQAGKTIFVSREELQDSDLDDHYDRAPELPLKITCEDLELPLIDSEIHMWTSISEDGEGLASHLHFNCPGCNLVHCTDLEDDDSNPRFACCDSCVWDSLVWLDWDEEKAEKLRSEQGAAP